MTAVLRPISILVAAPVALAEAAGSTSGLGTTPAWTAEGDQREAYFGFSVSVAGDVNGDGYSDVIVGVPDYDNDESDGDGATAEGRAFAYLGSAAGLATPAAYTWTARGDQSGALFGASASTAGDVNGDGYSDVIVGAPANSHGEHAEGRAFVYHGSPAGLSATPAWIAESDQSNALFGNSVSTAGDVNGDGYSDVIVGAFRYDDGENHGGRAFVYFGSPAGLAAVPAWTAEGEQADASFGRSVSAAGDVNGDGYSDVIVGADRYDNGENDEGRVFVYFGSAEGLAADAAWTAESDQAFAELGGSVSTAGDVNGDGYSDVLVGALWYDHDEGDEGRAFVYHGSAVGLAQAADWTAEGDQAFAFFGCSVSSAGDVNADGYSDVIVGASLYDDDQSNEGRAFVYHGSAAGLAAAAAWTAEGDQQGAELGTSVSTAGDVNGDGCSDVIASAISYDNGQTDEGRVFAYHGGGAGVDPVSGAEHGPARSPAGLRVSAAGRNPGAGNCELRLVLDRTARVQAEVIDVRGRSIATLAENEFEAGSHLVVWNGRDRSGSSAAPGVYFVRVRAGDETRVWKAALIR